MEALSIKTLAEFKKALALPSIRVQGLAHPRCDHMRPEFKADYFAPRQVARLQTNAFTLKPIASVNESWMYFQSAKHWVFDGSDVVRAVDGLSYRIFQVAD